MINNLNDWIKIDVVLQQKLKELESLEQEKEMIIAQVEEQGEITPIMEKKLNQSVEKYQKLANEIHTLKLKIKQLKSSN